MSEIKTAKTNKRSLKSNITKFKDKINSNIDDSDLALLELYELKIVSFYEELNTVFKAIFSHCEDKEVDEFINEKETIQDNLDEINLLIKRKLLDVNAVKNGNGSENSSFKNISVCEIKLPKITLPTFSGKIEEWIEFEDLFSASVHKNANLTNAQKLQYLKSSCKADALNIIQSIPISDSNYEIAWNLLAERYSNKKNLINAIIKKLLSLQQTCDTASSLLKFVDDINECVRSLKVLEQDVSNFSDTLIVYVLVEKLDKNTRCWWERSLKKDELGTVEQLTSFLKEHARTLEYNKPNFSYKKASQARAAVFFSRLNCVFCQEEHNLQRCPKFLNLSVNKRAEFVKNNNLCFNCLSSVHKIKFCKSLNKCKYCSKFHHSLIHFENDKRKPNFTSNLNSEARVFIPSESTEIKNSPAISASLFGNCNFSKNLSSVSQRQVLLCTALIRVKDFKGDYISGRCILDSGSQANFIRKDFANKLGIDQKDSSIKISCLGSFDTVASGEVNLTFSPHFKSNELISTSAFVINEITEKTPYISLSNEIKNYFRDLTLADPDFYKAQSVDILLGVNVFLGLLKGSVIKRNPNLPFAVSSKLGWIIAGTTFWELNKQHPISVNCISTNDLLQKFWDLEQVPNHNILTSEEKMCESQFESKHQREGDGRYSVSLPFKPNREALGNSKDMAVRRFLSLEKRLLKMPEIYNQYKEFMSEYLSLGHMEKVTENIDSVDLENNHYYIPHHYVLREASLSTRLRVVFDASAKSSSGISLNETLMIGPKVQNDLFSIILNFRCHNIAITADVQKMYRQVRIHDAERDFQRIVWRDEVGKPLEIFRLCTVTYGTSSAPYLATRSLKQLAIDEGSDFPKAANVILEDVYVDDVLTGTSTIEEGRELIIQLSQLLNKGGFELHKWFSNNQEIFNGVEVINKGEINSEFESDKEIKVLGIRWIPSKDEFNCSVVPPQMSFPVTKRKILSVISSIYDPLGWIAPFVVSAKIFLQQLWRLQLPWDECVPENVNCKWQSMFNELSNLSLIRIPRRVLQGNVDVVELHAFCDASEKAYAAVVYVRTVVKNNEILVRNLAAKTRVAPLKSISIPRLELCAALLLARLVQAIQSALHVEINDIYAWSDSTIVLSWLQAEPSKWQTFVANRVSEIQITLPTANWNHVQTSENPADCASRGLLPSELTSHHLWWEGPHWLSTNNIPLSDKFHISEQALVEERKKSKCAISQIQQELLPVIVNISSFSKLQRIIAWCLRFTRNVRLPLSTRKLAFLSTSEICDATNIIIRLVQATNFAREIQCLEKGKTLPTNSKIISLCPFLDDNKLLRVGGRLKNAELSENEKHPILIPKKHHLTEILVRHFHVKYLHASPELLLSLIRQKYWIISARSTIRMLVRKCVTCCRLKAQTARQIMADLPHDRVTQSRPFSCIGIDFAGYFMIKHRTGRGQRSFKCYVCIFICFAIKAVHLEVVEDLSTKAFLSALKRFISRRGKPSIIHSDCGTNFKGAHKEIQTTVSQFRKNEDIQGFIASEEIQWIFNPPAAPHFGGLWESAVKSMKYHLQRTVGDTILTYPEFSTLITQIEACLNSRPLCPSSTDPNDYAALTPGHFLVGTALTALPETDLSQKKRSHLDRWHVRQAILQQFWKRWGREYLTQLQQRHKWQKDEANLSVNDLVLIKDDNIRPLKWKLGRIIDVHPGPDKKVRVVSIRTSNGIIHRPIVKLCPLPIETKNIRLSSV